MTLQERIEDDLRNALKIRETKKLSLLRVLMVEITKKNKITSDEEVIKCIKKQIESAKLCHTEEEIPWLEIYLPKEMSLDDMKVLLVNALNERLINKSDVGTCMKVAKEVLGTDFDGKRVSAILKTL